MTCRRLGVGGAAAILVLAWTAPAGAVDGVVLINQAKALAGGATPGDAPGFPVTISVPGSYQLSSDLTVPAGTTGIEITANNVTLNLNGWNISGNGGVAGDGVFAPAGTENTTVFNGTVQGMGGAGVSLDASSRGGRIERVRALNNGGGGIRTGRFIGGSGQYRRVGDDLAQEVISFNTTAFIPGVVFAPNFRFYLRA